MAIWEDRDPRWLVQERDDGANVGKWHWEEKNRLEWTRRTMGEKLTGLSVDAAPLHAEVSISAVKSITGEVRLTAVPTSEHLLTAENEAAVLNDHLAHARQGLR